MTPEIPKVKTKYVKLYHIGPSRQDIFGTDLFTGSIFPQCSLYFEVNCYAELLFGFVHGNSAGRLSCSKVVFFFSM